MTVAKRINLLLVAGVVAAGAIATGVSVRSLRSAGEREAARVGEQLMLAKQEKLRDLVRNAHRAVEEIYQNAQDPERVADTYRPLLKGAVDVVFSAIETVYADTSLGEEEKRARAMAVVKGLRYGPEGKDYFWINDTRPFMVMHPYKPALDGTDLSGFKDPNGKLLFVEFARVCQADGEGFVDYLWPKYGADLPVPKLSYVRLFKPWGWVVGSGVYLEAAEARAQEDAKKLVASFRYGPDGKDYFWINDSRPYMVMHPYKPALDGTDLSGFKDPNGKFLFVEFARVCQAAGEGFVDYLWPKYGQDEPVAKLSFVKRFDPWDWIIGTGVYVDDVDAAVATKRAEIETTVNQQVWMQLASGGGVTVVLALLAALFTSRSFRPLHGVISALRDIAEGEGDLTKRLPLPYADCSKEKNCGLEECRSFGRQEACWSTVGSMQVVGELVQCPGVLSGQIKDCALCPVFQRVETDEFRVLSNWFNIFADKLRYTMDVVKQTMEVSGTLAEELSSSTSQIASSNRQISDQTRTVASAAEEMTATVTEVASLTAMVSASAGESRLAASDGAEVIHQV
ncbi:MAG TPA: methyl-accepting chemotaxis protein, partial [Deferrisomatales bacterium]|nr:methyl-accepting chemotaxis protein [Deferrisomatales bacterium]